MNILSAIVLHGHGNLDDVPFLPYLGAGIVIFILSLYFAVEITDWLKKK